MSIRKNERPIWDVILPENILVSVYDKSGLDELVQGLLFLNPNVIFYSTGGTGSAIREALGDVERASNYVSIEDFTDFPEMEGGLVDFSIIAGKNTSSNAIVIANEYDTGIYRVLGMGAGQPNRLDSVRKLAISKAKENLARDFADEIGTELNVEVSDYLDSERDNFIREKLGFHETVLFSDAFFPFPDGVVAALAEGLSYVVQPGGSIRDNEVIKAVDDLDGAMLFTGYRHFRH